VHAGHPFAAHTDPRVVFTNAARREALARLADGLGEREPFLLVTGDPGTGKTMLVREAVEGFGQRAAAVFVADPALTRLELLETVVRGFGAEPPPGAGAPQLLACFDQALARIAAGGRAALVVVEDAHDLGVESLEELRRLTNAASQASRAFEVVLVGSRALESRLADPALASLRQRVAVHCRVPPLAHKETRAYIHHRMDAAGAHGPRVFSRETCREIHARTGGVPRRINTLAAEAMRMAAEAGGDVVSPAMVRAAAVALWGEAPVATIPAPDEAATARTAPVGATESTTAEVGATQSGTAEVEATQSGAAEVETASIEAKPAPRPIASEPPPIASEPPPIATAPAESSGAAPTADEPFDDAPAPADPVAAPPPAARTAAVSNAAGATDESSPTGAGERAPDPAPATVPLNPDPRVREWVERFTHGQGPPRLGSRLLFEALEAEAVAGAAADDATAHLEGFDDALEARRRGDHARGGPAPRRRGAPKRSGARHAPSLPWTSVGAGAGVLLLVSVTMTMLVRRAALDPRGATADTVAAAVVSPANVGTAVALMPPPRPAGRSRDARASAPRNGGGAPARTAPSTPSGRTGPAIRNDAGVAARAVRADSAPSPAPRFTLEAATFLDADRAMAERDRLATDSGLETWMVVDGGGGAYRVVVGIFSSRERAETSADLLLGRGVVGQARVVLLPSRRTRIAAFEPLPPVR
jgi:type II secretory pathway predicted ATPase ExeA